MSSLFTELKRRNVFRVALAYTVVGWLVIQLVNNLVPLLGVPDWIGKAIFLVLLAGFPVALVLAWAYELTPGGMKKTAEVHKENSVTSSTGRKLDFVIIGTLVLALGYFVWDKYAGAPADEAGARLAETSIAVLPFVNMSDDKSNEYFSDGMTEEILNALVKVRELRVAARTSAFVYKGKSVDMRQVGRELGVSTMLEGSVRKDGDDLRITAQLIQVEDGFQLWSQTYDRKLANIFAIQEEIATAIAEALKVPLGLESGTGLVAHRIADMAIYEDYLRARGLYRTRGQSLFQAIEILEAVTAAEPDFAPAWGLLAEAYAVKTNYMFQSDGATLAAVTDQAEIAARRALALDPNLADAHGALADVYRDRHQWADAEAEYDRALAIDPNSSDILEDYSQFLNAVGRIKEAIAASGRSVDLDPFVPIFAAGHGQNLIAANRLDASIAVLASVRNLDPSLTTFLSNMMLGSFYSGRIEEGLEIMEGFGPEHFWSADYSSRLSDAMRTAAAGDPTKLQDLEYDPGVYFSWFGAVGAPTAGLKMAREKNSNFPVSLPIQGFWDPGYKAVRSSEEFKATLKLYRIPQYWRETGNWADACRPVGTDDFTCE